MTPLAATDKLFFERADAALDRASAEATLGSALRAPTTASFIWNIARANRSAWMTAGFAALVSTPRWGSACAQSLARATGYAHAGELSEPALRRAAESVAAVAQGHSGLAAEAAARHQCAALFGCQPARGDGVPGAHRPVGRD